MKAIIYGLRWDTDKAEKICDITTTWCAGTFGEVYRTPSGNWFKVQDGSIEIIHTDEDARLILENEDATEALEKYFDIQDA